MTLGGQRRGRALLVTAACVAVLLVAGRWLAVETAERAWAATVRGGPVYLEIRTLQRLLHWLVIGVSMVWGAGNLYIVYRAIGSVQMPRRIGNLEIVEAVPQRLLLTLAIVIGILFGLGLSWGTGDWWREAFLANAPAVVFGRVDPILHKEAGFYAAQLPWAIEREQFLLIATLTAAVLCGFLYLGIGSLRWQRGRVVASPHARAHLGVLGAGVAAAILWGALLDPAEVVAGLHGTLTTSLVSLRIRGAGFVVAAAGLAAILSFAWIWWDRPRWPATAWGVVGLALLVVYGILPSVARGNVAALYPQDRRAFEEMAFGANPHLRADLAAYPTMAAFVAAQPLWSPRWVAAVARERLGSEETVAGVQLTRTATGTPLWIVARAPNDTALSLRQPPPTWDQVHRGPRTATAAPLGLVETDSGALVPAPVDVRDSSLEWFGEGFGQYAVTSGAAPAASGIPLTGAWRRIALAWVLQSPEIFRRTSQAERLQWRRTPGERFARLAPFARFATPEPVMIDGALWWRAVGYVSTETFPLVAPVDPDGAVRLQRAGIVGATRGTTGETRFWLLPGADSVTAAWARIFKPLIEPADSAPAALLHSLQFPRESFTLAARRILAAAPDSENWQVVPHDPTDLLLPTDPTPWIVQGFTQSPGGATQLQSLLLGRFGDGGPELWSMIGPPNDPPPQLLVGSSDTQPGPLRLWIAGGHLASSQARFIDSRREAPRIEQVFLTWGNRSGQGTSISAALRELTLAGPPGTVDTTMASKWTLAQRLFSQLDSALVARDFERFGQVYRRLGDLLGARRRALAPRPP